MLTFDEATLKKADLYAELLIAKQLDPSDPILKALNLLVPGREINVGDEILEPYYIKALEMMANQPEKNSKVQAIMSEAYEFLGIDAEDSSGENTGLKIRVGAMILVLGRFSDGKSNAAANRSERLFTMARENGFDEIFTSKIIQFIEEQYPLS